MVDFLLDEDIWFTVESCSWMSIMWSPSLMVRFRGAAPDRKSLTCCSFKLSRACITDCSGFGLIRPVSALGRRVTVLPSTSRLVDTLPSTSSLSLYSR